MKKLFVSLFLFTFFSTTLVLNGQQPTPTQPVKPAVPVFSPPVKGEEKKDEKETPPTPKKVDEKDVVGPKQEKPTPVFPPAQPDDVPTVSEDDDGKIPFAFVKNRIEAMPSGTKAYVAVDAIRCDHTRKCWLNPDALYGTNAGNRVILVTKDENFNIVLPSGTVHQWTAQELPESVKWLPVKSVKTK